jgi:hypothetical protein
MQRLKAFRLFISLAAMLFVAKPFFGFGAFSRQFHPRHVHTILVKSFTKRKPESLEEADANVGSIHRMLVNPLALLSSTISALFLSLFPSVFRDENKIANTLLSRIRFALFPPAHAYLLSGKLII